MQRGFWFYFLSLGFRPFFLLAGAYGSLSILLWAAMYATGHAPTSIWPDTVTWHAHEMLFGYTSAVIGGFLLTAVPNWTKARPVKAWPLALLVSIWLAGRLGMFWSGSYPFIAATADLLFLPAIAISLLPSVIRAQSYRNVVFFFILAFMSFCNLGIHLAMSGRTLNFTDTRTLLLLAVFLIGLMITIFGGRVVPMFTRNALKLNAKQIEVKVPRIVEIMAISSSAAALPAAALSYHHPLTCGMVLLVAGASNLARMAFWSGHKTWTMPIVWILHAGYFWLSLGYLLVGLSLVRNEFISSLALHVFTMGGIGTLTLAMMSRVSLGHTGRPLEVSSWITSAYIALQVGIIIRVGGGFIYPDAYLQTVMLAALSWCYAFGVFTLVYIPILCRPRYDEKS